MYLWHEWWEIFIGQMKVNPIIQQLSWKSKSILSYYRARIAYCAHFPQRVRPAIHPRGVGPQGGGHRGVHEDPFDQRRRLHTPIRDHGRNAEGGDEAREAKNSGTDWCSLKVINIKYSLSSIILCFKIFHKLHLKMFVKNYKTKHTIYFFEALMRNFIFS